jgi:hypothetical protein
MSAISAVCKALRCAVDAAELFEEFRQVVNAGDSSDKPICVASVAFKTAALTLNVFAAGANYTGVSSQTLTKLKDAELAILSCDMPVQLLRETLKSAAGNGSVIEVLEKGVVAPLASIVRTRLERDSYHYAGLATLPLEERIEPVYDFSDPQDPKQIGTRFLSSEECQQRVADAADLLPPVQVVELAAKLGTASHAFASAADRYRAVFQQVAPQAAAVPVVAAAAAPAVPVDPLEVQLVQLPFIPAALHDDATFSRYVCPITGEPIRDPVGDPNGVTLYERAAILRWIQLHHISPITRAPLAAPQLVEKPLLRALINFRLNFHQTRLQQAIQAGLIIPAPAHLVGPAQLENPQY